MKLRKQLLVWRMHWLCAKQGDGKVLNPIGLTKNKSHLLQLTTVRGYKRYEFRQTDKQRKAN